MSIRVSDIVHVLNNAGIAYVVVGGFAVNLHGHITGAWLCASVARAGFRLCRPSDSQTMGRGKRHGGISTFEVADTSRRIDIFVDEHSPLLTTPLSFTKPSSAIHA